MTDAATLAAATAAKNAAARLESAVKAGNAAKMDIERRALLAGLAAIFPAPAVPAVTLETLDGKLDQLLGRGGAVTQAPTPTPTPVPTPVPVPVPAGEDYSPPTIT